MKKSILKNIAVVAIAILTTLGAASCKKEDNTKDKTTPTLTTTAISNITQNIATSGGNISSQGSNQSSSEVNARGVCWSTNANPTIANSKTIDGTGIGAFRSELYGLSPNTKYFVRAYATNSAGTSYGNEETFTTRSLIIIIPNAPIVTTKAITNITGNKATCGGNITSSTSVIARGVCYSSYNNYPTIDDNKTTDGTGAGSFTSNMTNLSQNTTYYVSAYATNSEGTSYGIPRTFKTDFNSVIIGTQTWMSLNLTVNKYNDGTDIPSGLTDAQWKATNSGAFEVYDNSQSNEALYGKLYNWYAVNSGKLAPQGWHIPSETEWNTLINYLGGEGVAGGALKATLFWNTPNTGATNSSGFTALPGGIRYGYNGGFGNGGFYGITDYCYYWSSSSYTASNAKYVSLSKNDDNINIHDIGKRDGISVRCIKD